MSYYLASSLRRCPRDLGVVDPAFARRGSSDGWIGDASHQASKSDHNPDWADGGVVRAIDVDVKGGALKGAGMAVVAAAIAHPATQYVIHAGYIWNRKYGFRRRVYTGAHKHMQHVHISIRHTRAAETSTHPWRLVGAAPGPTPPATRPDPVPPREDFDMDPAEFDKRLNAALTAHLAPVRHDQDRDLAVGRDLVAKGDLLLKQTRHTDDRVNVGFREQAAARLGEDAVRAVVADVVAGVPDATVDELARRLRGLVVEDPA